jgi:sulfate permease, SulP family
MNTTISPLPSSLKKQFSDEGQFTTFLRYLEPLSVRKGQFLFRKGDEPDGVYLVVSGQLSSVLELPGNRLKQSQTFSDGEIIGEGECYCNIPRLVSLIASQHSVLYHLSSRTWDRMELEAPGVAIAFHRYAFSSLSLQLGYVKKIL